MVACWQELSTCRSLDGYVCALAESRELDGYSFGGFLRWLEVQYNICNVGWGWDRILAHSAGSHEAAIRSLPDRFSQYCEVVASGAFDADTARERHFGGESREPDETWTEGWYDHLGDNMNPAAREFRQRLGELAGEKFG